MVSSGINHRHHKMLARDRCEYDKCEADCGHSANEHVSQSNKNINPG